jgi:hypothetical protein
MEDAMLAAAGNILLHTPWWAFAVFALLLVLGVQALRPRVIAPWRLLVTPAVFIGWGLVSLMLRLMPSSPLLPFDWLIAAFVGVGLAWITTRSDAMRVEAAGIAVPGSPLPLARNMLIFSAKYALTVAAVLAPARQSELALWDIAVSGVSAGYFLGWLARIALVYRSAPRSGPSGAPKIAR